MSEQGFQSSGLTPTGRPLVGLCNLSYLNQRQFYQQALIARLAIVDVALVHQSQCLVEEFTVSMFCLFRVALTCLLAHFEQRQGLRVFSHHQVSHVLGQALNEQTAIETIVDYRIQQYHHIGHLIT